MGGEADGQQRCHGSCSAQVTRVDPLVDALDALSNPPTRCNTSHHRPLREEPARSPERQQFLSTLQTFPALQPFADGFHKTFLVMTLEQRNDFRATASDWERTHSRIINPFHLPNYGYSPAIPVVDDANNIIGHMEGYSSKGFWKDRFVDVDGNELTVQTGEQPLKEDVLGNFIIETIGTLGLSLAVGMMRNAIAAGVARVGQAVIPLALELEANGLLSKKALDALCLYLRNRRAQALVQKLVANGERAVVNLGGTGEEAGAINLNPNPPGLERIGIPRHIKAFGEDMGALFKRKSVDEIVSNNLAPNTLGWDQIIPGAAKVLKSGGKITIRFRGGNVEEARKIQELMGKAGFVSIQVQTIPAGNMVFIGEITAVMK
jgi:hypothetical protein